MIRVGLRFLEQIAGSTGSVWSSLRLEPFDTSTVDGRNRERIRRITLTFLSSAFSQGATFLLLIVSLRLALPLLGSERYGVLATIASGTVLFSFVDFGLGNALIGHIARLDGRDQEGLARSVTSAFWTLATIGAGMGTLMAVFASYGPIELAFANADSVVLDEARTTLLWFSLIFGASVPLGSLQRVFWGLQRGYVPNLLAGLLSLCGTVALLFWPLEHAGMSTFLWLTYGLPTASGAVLTGIIARRRLLLAPTFHGVFSRDSRALFREGSFFFLAQLGVMAGWGSDNLILSATIGPAGAAILAVAARIGQAISVPLYTLNNPLWAAYADAYARRDIRFVRRTLKSSLLATFAVAVMAAALLLWGREWISRILTHGTIEVPPVFFATFLIWTILGAVGNSLALYLNGTQVFRPQVICILLFILVSLPLKIFAASAFGLTGLVCGAIMAYSVTVVLPYLTIFRGPILSPLRTQQSLSAGDAGKS
jgi:O-antigen/teichoic acid export membrane protein